LEDRALPELTLALLLWSELSIVLVEKALPELTLSLLSNNSPHCCIWSTLSAPTSVRPNGSAAILGRALAGVSAGGRNAAQPAKPGIEDLDDVLRAWLGLKFSFSLGRGGMTFSFLGIGISLWNRGGEGSKAEGAEMTGWVIEGGLELLLLFDQPKISPNPFLVLVFFCNFDLSTRGGDALFDKKAGIAEDLNDRGMVQSSIWTDIFSFSFDLDFSPKSDEGIFLSEFRSPPPVCRKLDGGNWDEVGAWR
jgi:hypothetical protein